MFATPALQWQKEHLLVEVFRLARFGDKLQVTDAGTDGNAQLVCEDDTWESLAHPLPPRGLGQQIIILREQDTAKRTSTVQQGRVVQLAPSSRAVSTSTPRRRSPPVMARGT